MHLLDSSIETNQLKTAKNNFEAELSLHKTHCVKFDSGRNKAGQPF